MTQRQCDRLKALREQIVDAHIHAETSARDIQAVLATFRHPLYEVPAFDVMADGPKAVEGLHGQLLGAFPDFRLERTATHHPDHAVMVECRFGGTHRAEWAGVAATGRPMAVQAACVFVSDGADPICENVYFDHATVLRQLNG